MIRVVGFVPVSDRRKISLLRMRNAEKRGKEAAVAGILRPPIRVIWLCFLEARPAVQGIFLLRFLAGASLAGTLANWWVWGSAAIWGCAVWAIYLLNGVTDAEEDRINASSRPISRGALSPRTAALGVAVLATASLAGAFVSGNPAWWSVAALLALGWLYSAPPLRLKRWPAGLVAVVVPAGLLTFYVGHAASGGEENRLDLLVFATVMTLWMALVGQTKDLPDAAGDAQTGRRSLPVVWGEDASRLAFSAVALLLAVTLVSCALSVAPDLLPPGIVVAFGALAVAATALGGRSRGSDAGRRRPYGAFMLTQYGANAAVVVF